MIHEVFMNIFTRKFKIQAERELETEWMCEHSYTPVGEGYTLHSDSLKA